MFGQNRQNARPIEGAVATVGVDERVAFIRRTYMHLAGAIALFVGLEYLFLTSELGASWVIWAFSSQMNWFLVLGLFMVAGWLGDKWARSDTSQTMQYVGLGVYIVAETLIMAPLLFIAAFYYPDDPLIIQKAAVLTLVIFGGLTATVFMTKKDFSFMGNILGLCMMGALGIILASMLFGFHLGVIFAGVMIILAGGYVLYYTSQVLAHLRPTQHVAGALMLFSAIALLFYYILYFLMSLRD
jgi:hypothetical protein